MRPHCREKHDLDESAWKTQTAPWKAPKPTGTIYIAKSCLDCRMTGYMGRVGIYEIMVMNSALRSAIGAQTGLEAQRDRAYKEGMKPLRISGAMKVATGVNTIDEIMKVAPAPSGDRRHHGR